MTAPTPERIRVLRQRVATAQAEVDRLSADDTDDPASARLTGAALKQRHRNTRNWLEAGIRAEHRLALTQADLRSAMTRMAEQAEREAEAARPKYTAADLADAAFVTDKWGDVRNVTHVNTVTVAVGSGYSWVDRLPIASIRRAWRADRTPIAPGSAADAKS